MISQELHIKIPVSLCSISERKKYALRMQNFNKSGSIYLKPFNNALN